MRIVMSIMSSLGLAWMGSPVTTSRKTAIGSCRMALTRLMQPVRTSSLSRE